MAVCVRLRANRLTISGNAAEARAMPDPSRPAAPADPDFVRLRLPFDWADEAIAAVLRLPDAVEVIEPAWLRQAIVDSARRILARYSEGSAGGPPGRKNLRGPPPGDPSAPPRQSSPAPPSISPPSKGA